jgi:hypothetical protein
LSRGLERYYGRLRRPPGTPPTSPLSTGYRARRSDGTIRRPPGRGGPPQFPPPPSERSTPHTPGGSSGPHVQALRPFHRLHPDFHGLGSSLAVWGKETRFNCRVGVMFGLWCAARVKSLAEAPGERDPWLQLARWARAADGFGTPAEPFARATNAGVSLVHRAYASAAMTAAARPSSRREKAQRWQPTAAADLAPAERTTAPRHRWWRAPRLPRRRPPLRELERSARTRCPRVRQRARREDRRRACSALGRAGTRPSWGRSGAAPGRAPRRATGSRPWWPRR